ncbi:MAG: histidinol-phosphate aminotransferase family protein [Thermanaerothrix sp.]|nr:histidinol-phosphate aminotransferase family protein [Thermanaerothrix sp.]
MIYQLAAAPWKVLDFSSNVNPYGPPKGALRAARLALKRANLYPDPDHTALREAFAKWLAVKPEMTCFGNGASELIGAVMMALRPKRMVTFSPTFGEYGAWASRLGIPVLEIPMRAPCFEPPLEDLDRRLEKGDLLVICQPNNPTGRAYSDLELKAITRACHDAGAYLLADECFINLTYPPSRSIIDNGSIPAGSIALRAFTKDFSAPGLRVGAAVTTPETVGIVRRALQPWPLNCAGEAFATWCSLNPEPFLQESREKLAAEREYLTRSLRAMGFEPLNSSVNFILCTSPWEAKDLLNQLKPMGILIRTCESFGLGKHYVRIAVKDRKSNRTLIGAIGGQKNV